MYHYGPGAVRLHAHRHAGDAARRCRRTGGRWPSTPSAPPADLDDLDYVLLRRHRPPTRSIGIELTWNQPVDGVIVDDNVVAARELHARLRTDLGVRRPTRSTSYTGLIRHRSAGPLLLRRATIRPAPARPTIDRDQHDRRADPAADRQGHAASPTRRSSPAFRSSAFTYDAGNHGPLAALRRHRHRHRRNRDRRVLRPRPPRTAASTRSPPSAATRSSTTSRRCFRTTFTRRRGGAQAAASCSTTRTTNYLVTVDTATAGRCADVRRSTSGAGHHDLVTIAAGRAPRRPTSRSTRRRPLRATSCARRASKIDDHRRPVTAALDTRIQVLNADETVARHRRQRGVGADDIASSAAAEGWTAFAVVVA